MKTVFTNQELFHVFASGAQENGRSANGNVFFSGSTLYSYGQHFPIAIRYKNKMLLNADSYSVTTSKHQTQARYALRHWETVSLPALRVVAEIIHHKKRLNALDKDQRQYRKQEIDREARAYVQGMAREIKNAKEKLQRARSLSSINRWAREIDRFEKAALFVWRDLAGKRSNPIAGAIKAERQAIKARLKKAIQFDLDQFTRENKEAHAQKRLAELQKMQENLAQEGDVEYTAIRVRNACESVQSELRRKRVAINAGNREFITKEAQEKLEAAYAVSDSVWQEYFGAIYQEACDTVKRYKEMEYQERVQKFHAREIHAIGTGDTICRVNGDIVETSRGARVPLNDAIKLFKSAKFCRDNDATYNGPKEIGMYRLDKIDAQGNATIGCHYLKWEAIQDCAARYVPELIEMQEA